jgi:hypothetical protein
LIHSFFMSFIFLMVLLKMNMMVLELDQDNDISATWSDYLCVFFLFLVLIACILFPDFFSSIISFDILATIVVLIIGMQFRTVFTFDVIAVIFVLMLFPFIFAIFYIIYHKYLSFYG